MQPVSDLRQLDFWPIFDVENYGMDTVGVANEVVVDHVVGFDAGELPDA